MFESISRFNNLQIILLEPASDLDGSPDTLDGSLPRKIFSYTHNYQHYAENAGMVTVLCRIIRPYIPGEAPAHEGVVRFFYRAHTK